MEVKVSVIIPVYNVEPYLRECVESILNQTLREIELICVDDGSTDGSLSILREYEAKDSRVTVLTQKNQGGGAARNKGLAIAKGKYLSLLDSDDFFAPDMLEKTYQCCEERNAEICVYQVLRYEDGTGKTWWDKNAFKVENIPEKEVFSYRDMPDCILNTFQNWAWNKLISRELVEKNQIRFQEIFRTNDLLFVASCMVMAERITVLEEKLVYYRVGMKNSCQSTNARYPMDFLKAFYAVKEFLQQKGIYEIVEKSFLNQALSGCVYNLNSIRDMQAKEELFLELKNNAFQRLGIAGKEKSYFQAYNEKNYDAYLNICKKSFREYTAPKSGTVKSGTSGSAASAVKGRLPQRLRRALGKVKRRLTGK